VRAWLVIAAIGAVVCTVCDHLHVTTGVLGYPRPFVWQQAWWVPLLFAGATAFCVWGARTVRGWLRARPLPPATGRTVIADGIAFVTAYAFTAYGNSLPNVVLGVLVAAWLARVASGMPGWLVVYSLIVAAGGMLFEAGFSGLGFFHYHAPDYLGVARWLPALYLHAALLAATVERRIASDRQTATV
jgi:hypothetical protein